MESETGDVESGSSLGFDNSWKTRKSSPDWYCSRSMAGDLIMASRRGPVENWNSWSKTSGVLKPIWSRTIGKTSMVKGPAEIYMSYKGGRQELMQEEGEVTEM